VDVFQDINLDKILVMCVRQGNLCKQQKYKANNFLLINNLY